MSDQNNPLLQNIQSSIKDMQEKMKDTYSDLANVKITGKSLDGTVIITMTATYGFEDIEFDERAMAGGIKEFKWRIREAWKNLSEEIQKTTQAKTMELLQGMDIPDEIRNLSLEQASDEDKS